ncbi:hypothetical protein BKA66DRAFT_443223 [Pyrenochaeta sp. MPI-SDFR-AT-0127]|nr:hypothetical protein BKA66DRAFT_443223 [Pyrenochaeta sp. MPI-SDFR-AT-0127]
MDNNYPQPFYGLPFAYPPPQMPQPAPTGHPEEHAGPPRNQHPPVPEAFQSIPGLPQFSLPGINLASYGQNSQQPPFNPPAAWPPQLPSDPMWLPFLQNGTLPPPPFPGMGFPPRPPLHNPQNPPMPLAFPPHAPPQPPLAASERIQEVMDSDKEDGELSEQEHSSQPHAAKASTRAYPEPPRSVPQPLPAPPRVEEAYNPDRPAAGQQVSQDAVQRGSQQGNPPTLADKIQKDRDDAKQFIKILNSNNIGYRALANENLDGELLRGLYQSLNLPSEPAPILPPKINGAEQKLPAQTPADKPAPGAKAQQHNSVPAVKVNIAPAAPSKSAASPTAPGDRRDYIARLQAAKMAKQAGGAKSSPPQKTPPAKAATPVPAVITPQPATTPTAKLPVTDEQRARNTELIKQRLEAMRAKQKPQNAFMNGAVPSPLSHHLEQDRAEVEPTVHSVPSGTHTPITPAHMPLFPGIPGLFMGNSPSYSNSTPNLSKSHPSIPQKRPAPSDTETSTPHGSVTPYTRPPAQSPYGHQEDSMIIEVSDDESNGSDMDIDDDQSGPQPATSLQDHRFAPGNLPDFSSRSGSTKPASAISTPGPQTPATVAREKELEDKEKQLAAMRLTLKRKLAEKREKDKAAAAAVATSSPFPQDTATPRQSFQGDSTPKRSGETIHAGHVHSINASTATRDTKRLRRAEIQSRLPSLDAEIATNTSRMEQLTREMEQLLAQNERITKDKEQLTQELESLGIDTEGMSHAELRAKKDEIELEQSPEPEKAVAVASASQTSASESLADRSIPSQGEASSFANIESRLSTTTWPAQGQSSGGYASLPGLGLVSPQAQSAAALPQKPIVDDISVDKGIPQPEAQLRVGPQSDERSRLVEAREALVEATVASATRGSATPLDEDDFYSPAPVETGLDISANTYDAHQPQLATPPFAVKSPSEEGEVEMSESSDDEEEEYEPEEPAIVTDTRVQAAQMLETESLRSVATSQVSTEDEEDYEPPDVDQNVPDAPSEAFAAELNNGMHQAEPEDGAMDIATSSSDDSDDSDSDEETTPEPETHISLSANNAPQEDTHFADDLAPELQPEIVPVASGAEAVPTADEEDEKIRFTPYESPLRMFKSYRYHPSYAQDVAGGFLSLTFSHQIDPERRLCQFESAGGSCNDAECPDQHFRDLNITGEKLLVQLGTANPGKTPDEKQKWNDGLRGVLKELRQKNIKDPNGIAVEIAKYRRQFLNDDTRVVNL